MWRPVGFLCAWLVAAGCGDSARRAMPGSGGSAGGAAGGAAPAAGAGGGVVSHYGGFSPSGGTRAVPSGGRAPSDAGEAGLAGESGAGGEPGFELPPLGCELGTWDHDADEGTPCEPWRECAAGRYVSNAPSPSEDRMCLDCPAGTFSATANARACLTFSVCGADSTVVEPPSATQDRRCSCQNGGAAEQAASGRAVCDCPAGTWGPTCSVTSVQVVTGSRTCVLRSDQRVACWGMSFGNGQTPPDDQFESISICEDLACGVRLDGTLVCWGDDSHGEESVPNGTFSEVSAGRDHACAVRDSGDVVCWGDDTFGQAAAPAGAFARVAAEAEATCALETDGDLVCWGQRPDNYPQPPTGKFAGLEAGLYGGCAVADDGSWRCWDAAGDNLGEAGVGPFARVVPSWFSGCFIDGEGVVACVGASLPAQHQYSSVDVFVNAACGITKASELICTPDVDGYVTPLVPPSGAFKAIAVAAMGASCSLRTDGKLACWYVDEADVPDDTFVSITAGISGFCGVLSDGSARCFQAGAPVPEQPRGAFRQIALGYRHIAGVALDGTLVVEGDSDAGRSTPPPGQYLAATAGYFNNCALRSDGRALCWVGTARNRLEPPDDLFQALAMGYGVTAEAPEYACGIRLDGTLRCWGSGLGSVTPPAGEYVSLTAGPDYACAVSAVGEATCWGDAPPAPESGVMTQVAASRDYGCGLTDGGRVQCRGLVTRPVQ